MNDDDDNDDESKRQCNYLIFQVKILVKEGEFSKGEIPEFNEIYEMSEVSFCMLISSEPN